MEDENTSSKKDRSKNPKRGVQTAPEHERVFGVQRPIRHFWSVELHSKRAEFSFVGLWPNGLWVTIMHTLFDLFAKGCVQIHTLIIHAYFLECFDLYKQRLNLIIEHLFFYTLGGIRFRLSYCSYFLFPSLSVTA